MSKLIYKINVFFSKTKYKLSKNKKLHFFLNSKIIWWIMGVLLLILSYTYYYSLNNHHWFQRLFNYYVYPIKNIENKIFILLVIDIIYFIWVLAKKIKFNFLPRINIFQNKKYLISFVIYSVIIYFLSFIELKTKVLAIISPLVLYFIYNIYNYIQQDKTKFKLNFLIDSRYFFLIALVLLIYTPIYIYFKDQKFAETLSIYAYYFLVIWVVYEIISSKFQK